VDVAVSGSSGLVGSALVPALAGAGHRPIRLVRREPEPGADEIRWHPAGGAIDAASLEGIGAVIHLAGAGIGDRRWSARYKETLTASRTGPTELLASTLASLARPAGALLSASGVNVYGNRGAEILTEASPPGSGFLAGLVQAWEASTAAAAGAGIRTVLLRSGAVYSASGGALAKMLPLFKLGLGGRFGSGRQYQPWITIDDEVGAILHLLASTVSGPVNLTAPEPITNATFAKTLGAVLGRPTFVPVPAFGPKLVLGREMAQTLLFDSLRIVPEVLTADGYRFAHPDIETGLRAVLGTGAATDRSDSERH
jgi:hypothetical protein